MKALLLGIPGKEGLRYIGRVGGGFSEAERKALIGLLAGREIPSSCPGWEDDRQNPDEVAADAVIAGRTAAPRPGTRPAGTDGDAVLRFHIAGDPFRAAGDWPLMAW